MMLLIRSKFYSIRVSRLMSQLEHLIDAYELVFHRGDRDACEAIQAEINHVRGKLDRLFAFWEALVKTRGAA